MEISVLFFILWGPACLQGYMSLLSIVLLQEVKYANVKFVSVSFPFSLGMSGDFYNGLYLHHE